MISIQIAIDFICFKRCKAPQSNKKNVFQWVMGGRIFLCKTQNIPESKVNGANMGPIWGRQDQGGSHIVPMNFAIWDTLNIWRLLY